MARVTQGRAGAVVLTLLVAVCDLRFAAAAAAAAASSRPDYALFTKAEQAAARLQASATRQKRARDWENVVEAYRNVVYRYPQSPYSDNALLAVGDLYNTMAVRFKDRRYRTHAVSAYRSVVAEYPSSSKGEEALYKVFELTTASRDRRELTEAAKAYLEAFPHGARARQVKAAVRQKAPTAPADVIPKPPPPGLAQIYGLRFWSGANSTRIVIDLQREVSLEHERLQGPDRLSFDLAGTRLHPNLMKAPRLPVGDGLLEAVRIAQNRPEVVRVVLDLKKVKDHTTLFLQNPTRLVIDVRGSDTPSVSANASPPTSGSTTVAAAEPFPTLAPNERGYPTPGPRATPAPAPTPIVIAGNPTVAPAASPTTGPAARPSPIVATARPTPVPRPIPTMVPFTETRAASGTATPLPPQANRDGSLSIVRQLGLGARTIVIDAGHGGHDPGSIGHGGLAEKDLVLDVALRLEKLVRSELGAEVVMTRSTDVFIPLEERTGIANSRGADLFLSIHANSSRSRAATGIETYFLNFARDPHAEEVAARENAITAATLKDLQPLVKAIALNGKIDESRDFATSIQEAMIASLRPENLRKANRGVRTAPFYVLIGANMPSILAEISFVSNPEDEKLLKTSAHKDKIAQGLLAGVRTYLHALNRAPIQQLTAMPRRSKVSSNVRTLPSLRDEPQAGRGKRRPARR